METNRLYEPAALRAAYARPTVKTVTLLPVHGLLSVSSGGQRSTLSNSNGMKATLNGYETEGDAETAAAARRFYDDGEE